MSSGGMDWAYRVLVREKLDALGAAIVLHLGWRDAPNFRTDRGIAGALGFDRASVRRATAKLVALGVIQRRSGQWVACETVAIVEQSAGALRPSVAARDAGASSPPGASSPRGPQAPGGGGLKPPQKGASSLPTEKENIEKGEAVEFSSFQRAQLREGKPVLIGLNLVKPGSQAFQAAALAARAQDAEKGGL